MISKQAFIRLNKDHKSYEIFLQDILFRTWTYNFDVRDQDYLSMSTNSLWVTMGFFLRSRSC